MESGFLGQELIGGFLDRSEVIEIELQEDQVAFGAWTCSFDVLDGNVGFVFGACCNVDFRVL